VKVRPGQVPEVVLDGLKFPTGLTIRGGSPTSPTAASAPAGAGCFGSHSDLSHRLLRHWPPVGVAGCWLGWTGSRRVTWTHGAARPTLGR
jgi:hypothetical protein